MGPLFVDQVKIYVKAGDGGDGSVSFRREKYVPRGGPDGGDGGNGGNVILEGTGQLSTLLDLRYQQHYLVPCAEHGSGQKCSGKNGADWVIPVPIGTIIRDAASGEIVADITEQGQQIVVARGGHGGRGNTHFKSATRQVPRIAEPGEKGEERWLALELKLLADVGVVGLPNAGKSTLLAAISSARPKVADYPFTTLTPNLGVVAWKKERERQYHFTIADVPGLIEGAHEGKGLGIRFLKHLERTTLLLHLVDVSMNATANPICDFETVRSELASYGHGLLDKPYLVAATKMDVEGPHVAALQHYCQRRGIPFFQISAVTNIGIKPLILNLGHRVESARQPLKIGEMNA